MRPSLATKMILALVALIGWPTGASAEEPSAKSTVGDGEFAGLVAIPDGRRLYLECHGSGSPTVIFEAGVRSRGDIWLASAAAGAGSEPAQVVGVPVGDPDCRGAGDGRADDPVHHLTQVDAVGFAHGVGRTVRDDVVAYA